MTRRTLASLTAASQSRRGVNALLADPCPHGAPEWNEIALSVDGKEIDRTFILVCADDSPCIIAGGNSRSEALTEWNKEVEKRKCPNSPAR